MSTRLPARNVALTLFFALLAAATPAVGQHSVKSRSFLFEGPGEAPGFMGNYGTSSTVINQNNDSKGRLAFRPDWFDPAWKMRMRIAVDNPGPAMLTEFPVALTIPAVYDLFWAALAGQNGADLRVTGPDGKSEIPFWLEEFNDGSDLFRSCPELNGRVTASAVLGDGLNLDGKQLSYRVNGTSGSVTFSGTALTAAQVVDQINQAPGGLRAQLLKGRLQLLVPKTAAYRFNLELLPAPNPIGNVYSILKLSPGVFSENFIADPVFDQVRTGVSGPCLNIWIQPAALPPGRSFIYIYYNNDSGVPSKSNVLDVFSYSSPEPLHMLLSDREAVGDLWLVSFANGNQIRLGDLNGPLLTLDALVGSSFGNGELQLGLSVLSTAPFAGLFDGNATDALTPLSYAGREFIIPTIRGSDGFTIYSPVDEVEVVLKDLTTGIVPTLLPVSVTLSPGQLQTIDFDTADRDPTDISLERNIVHIRTRCVKASCITPPPILVYHLSTPKTGSPVYSDSVVGYPGSTDLWGIASTQAHLGVVDEENHISVFTGGNTRFNLDMFSAETHTIGSSEQGTGASLHVISRSLNSPLGMIQFDDRDGLESSVFLPYFELGRRYLIPRPAEYVAIAATWPNTSCTLRWGACTTNGHCNSPAVCVRGRCQVQKTSADYPYPSPTKIYFGRALTQVTCANDGHCVDGQSCVKVSPSVKKCRFPIETISAGNPGTQDAIELTCSDRVWAMYEDADYDDERQLLAIKSRRKVLHELWPEALVDLERTGIYPSIGMIETPTFHATHVVLNWLGISAVTEGPPSFALGFQVNLGAGWLYWNGSAWVPAQATFQNSNSAAELDQNLSILPISGGQIAFRIIFRSDTLVTPTIDTLTLQADTLDGPPVISIGLPQSPVIAGVPQTVTATVTQQDGTPIPRLRVDLSQQSGPANGTFSPSQGTSDANGTITVSFTPPVAGAYTLRARVPTGSGDRTADGVLTVIEPVADPGPDQDDADLDSEDTSDLETADLDAFVPLDQEDANADLEDATSDLQSDFNNPDEIFKRDQASDQPEIDLPTPDPAPEVQTPDQQTPDSADVELDQIEPDTAPRATRISGTTVFGCSAGAQDSRPGSAPLALLLAGLLVVCGIRRRFSRDSGKCG